MSVVDEIEMPRPVAFVLGGGGSLGAGQVGMLRALGERGVRADLVVGTSVGSVNGALLALDPANAPGRLADIWGRMTRAKVFPGGPIAQLSTLRKHRNHLFPNTGLAEILATELAGVDDFANLQLPFGAVAVDAMTGQAVLITEGPLTPAILASAAIPGIYPPVHHQGRVLYDGGVVANVPIRQALASGAKSLVILDCAFPGHLPRVPETLADAVLFWATLSMRTQAVLESELASSKVPILYLPGSPVQNLTPLDFGHTAELIASSYASSSKFLNDVRIDGPGLYGNP
jgi:NTE family protein